MNNRFISQDKDIIIEFNKTKRLNLFDINSIGNEYICNIKFINNLGITIKEINTTELEIYKFIDCVYNFLEIGQDLVFSFSTDKDNYSNPIIIIRLDEFTNKNNFSYFRQFFRVCNLIDESLQQQFSFDITDNLIELLDKLYNFFILDSNIINKELLSPEYILENNC